MPYIVGIIGFISIGSKMNIKMLSIELLMPPLFGQHIPKKPKPGEQAKSVEIFNFFFA